MAARESFQHNMNAAFRHTYNDMMSKWLTLVEGNTHTAFVARLFYTALVLVCGTCIVAASRFASRDVHVLFWLGETPLLTLCITSLALCLHFTQSVYLRVLKHDRMRELASRESGALNVDSRTVVQKHLTLRRRTTKDCLCVLVVIGAVSSFLGCLVASYGVHASYFLTSQCGKGGSTKRLEETHRHLVGFHKKCFAATHKRLAVEQCPGFELAFPPPAPYVKYLKDLEHRMRCTGFCHFGSAPMFASNSTVWVQSPDRCATKVGRRILLASQVIGWPSGAIGFGVFICSLLLMNYEEV